MHHKQLFFMLLMMGAAAWAALAQAGLPDPSQIYRFIKISNTERAGDVRWIEIWEQNDGSDFELTMLDSEGTLMGMASSCHYVLALGNSTPLYLVDDERIPVPDAATLRQEIENRRLVVNVNNFVQGLECVVEEQVIINGVQAERCTVENDAFGLFLVRPPATAEGNLWVASNDGYPVRYDFSAAGQRDIVAHRYELLQPAASFAIVPQQVDEMVCFDGLFPAPNGATLLNGGLNFSIYESGLRVDELETFYDLALAPDWQSVSTLNDGGRLYRRTLADGATCTLSLRYSEGRDSTRLVAASVFPETLNPDSLNLPDDFQSPVVVQNVYSFAPIVLDGTVPEVVNFFIGDYQSQGWSARDELTDVREDSAFVVLAQGEQEEWLTFDALADNRVSVTRQTRAGVCGPTFDVP